MAKEMTTTNKPIVHIAFIMDGNGRWAKKRHLPRYLGHKEGCYRIKEIADACLDRGIKVMSLYAFSTENWKRPKTEINHLFTYLDQFFKREIDYLYGRGVRIVTSGDLSRLPEKTRNTVLKAIDYTKDNKVFTLNICLNYGGRDEIIRATKAIATDYKEGKISLDDINEVSYKDYLYTKDLPDVDLFVRTSGELRTSNFLPYQLIYAEMVFPQTYWPDFKVPELDKVIEEFNKRNRRYGGIDEK